MLTAEQHHKNITETKCYTETKRGKLYLVTEFGGSRKPQREPIKPGLDNQRVRFNWGFWDARSDVKNGRAVCDVAGHFDRAYADGYVAGIAGGADTTSEPAWLRSGRADDFGGWR